MMGIRINAVKSMVWNNETNQMVIKTAVSVDLVGNQGTVFASEGPIYCETGQEIFEASMILKQRLVGSIIPNDTII